ncbi:LppA family lipoprotein [Saccharopolyspora sp. TS4A08]|uniref:LppA family lipoprotein n=1 Tax=Saccharopolyspora ipomoeae TaxID=3042027 RepID=A0ABT6PX05_9PSEU|nr:LppA family lipoprotein [Saccharopolyspora sp. TS4A08]MDI2032545.1 LppA family lipoprotein [Saccharopolyspora sp. TS4A08]
MRRLAPLILAAALLTGCAGQPDGGSMEDQLNALRQRPTLGEVTADYDRMQQELRERLVAELGLPEFSDKGNTGQSACTDFADVPGAEQRTLATWMQEGGIPDEKWERALQIATEVGSTRGFTELHVVTDRPGDHKIELHNSYGAKLQLGSAANTVLSVRTGCHLAVKG